MREGGCRLTATVKSILANAQTNFGVWGRERGEEGRQIISNRQTREKKLATEQCICDTNGIKQVGDLKEGDSSAVCGFYLRRYSRGQTLRLTSWTLLLLLFLLLLGAPKVPKVALACRNHSIPIAYKDMGARSHEQW